MLVQRSIGNPRYGGWRVLNKFAYDVIDTIVTDYRKDNSQILANRHSNNRKNRQNEENKFENKHNRKDSALISLLKLDNYKKKKKSRNRRLNNKRKNNSIDFGIKNELLIFKQLFAMEIIEQENSLKNGFKNYSSNNDINNDSNNRKFLNSDNRQYNSEDLKCRFRSRFICGNVIEHLHDRYLAKVSLQYEKFYRDWAMAITFTLNKIYEEYVDSWLLDVILSIDYVCSILSIVLIRIFIVFYFIVFYCFVCGPT